MLMITLIVLSTTNSYSIDYNENDTLPKVKKYNGRYILVEKKYFVDLHLRSSKFDSLSFIFYQTDSLYERLSNQYDSLKSTFNLKLTLEKKAIENIRRKNAELKKINDEYYTENKKNIELLATERKKNKFLKKATIGSSLLTLIILIIK